MASASNDIDDIRRQMAQIRRELHEDVQGVVAGAEAATDWRRYVKLYPWACVGAALTLGFLIAPRRRRHGVERVEQAVTAFPEQIREAVQAVVGEVQVKTAPEVRKKEEKAGLIGAALGMLWPVALRFAKNYAMNFAEGWIAQQTAAGKSPLAFLQNIPGMAGMPDIAAMMAGMPPGVGDPPSPSPSPGVPPGSYGVPTGPAGPKPRPSTPGL